MTEVITDKERIEKIISTNIKGKKLIFTRHYRISSAQKGIDDEKVIEIFSQFNKVYAIEKDVLRYGDIGYELFYDLSNNTYFSIAVCPKDNEILIIHAVEYKRKLDSRLRRR